MNSWKDKWDSVQRKLKHSIDVCVVHPKSQTTCKDAVDSVLADIWNMKDWLIHDPVSGITKADMDSFIATSNPKSFFIRACGDVETFNKHYSVDNPHMNHTNLEYVGEVSEKDGLPILFLARRKYRGSEDIDEWEDANELAHRAVKEWRAFLVDRGLL